MQFSFDERKDLVIPGDLEETILYALTSFVHAAEAAIADHGFFACALSGGSTPKILFQRLSQSPWKEKVAWQLVRLFWSDERSVPPDHPDSNYHMAMEAGLKLLPIPKDMIFRMQAEDDIENNAVAYETALKEYTHLGALDLVMLGMGEDGHTASLFPKTHGLTAEGRDVIANYIPSKKSWRMSLSFEGIAKARHSIVIITGKNKALALFAVLNAPYDPTQYPIQNIGAPFKKALWVVDQDAASKLLQSTNDLS